jgi:transposase
VAAPKKYPDELRQRAVRLYRESDPKPVIRRLAEQLGVHHEALRNWIRQAEADAGQRTDRPSTDLVEENRRLAKENAELRRANEILKSASLDSKSQSNTLGRGAVAEALAGPVVQPGGHGIQIGLAVETEVGAFR